MSERNFCTMTRPAALAALCRAGRWFNTYLFGIAAAFANLHLMPGLAVYLLKVCGTKEMGCKVDRQGVASSLWVLTPRGLPALACGGQRDDHDQTSNQRDDQPCVSACISSLWLCTTLCSLRWSASWWSGSSSTPSATCRRCGTPQHGLSSNKMAPITSGCGATRSLRIKWA